MPLVGASEGIHAGASSWRVRLGILASVLPLHALAADPKASPPPDIPAGRILYHEQSGGMLSNVPPPAGARNRPRDAVMPPAPAPVAAPAPAKRKSARVTKPAAEPARAEPVRSEPLRVEPARAEPRPTVSDAQRERLEYAAMLQRHAAFRGTAAERARALADEGGERIVAFRDADVALALGWLWLEGRDPASAALWFARTAAWAPQRLEAQRGLAYAALAENDFERALAAAERLPASPDRAALRRDALVGLAARHHRSERFTDAAARFAEAAGEGELPRYARALHAWSTLGTGRRSEARGMFAALYREAPDTETAEGLLATGAVDPGLAATEPLAGLVRRREAERAFGARRFLEAAALDADTFSPYGAVNVAHVALAGGWRDKSGTEGTSRLHVDDAVGIDAYLPLRAAASLRLRADRTGLDAGADTRATVRSHSVTLRWERGLALEGSLGRVAGPALPALAVGGAEVSIAPAWGQASLTLARAPVRESILSYVGVRDAVEPDGRGQVAREGIEARALWLGAAPWSVGGRVGLARYRGTHVEENDYRAIEVSAGRDLQLEGFAYAALGLSLSDERFERNLSGFAAGEGGYFSPQRYRRAGLAFDFMTAEKCVWIVRGRASAGRVRKREDDFRSLGNDYALALGGAFSLSPHLHIGWALARGLSPQYRETQALVQVKVLMEPRLYVASADIPGLVR